MALPSDLLSKQDGFGGHVRVSYQSDVAIITMDRGENRMNEEFIDQLNAALDEILSKPNVRAIITTARGKYFSNGLDLKWLMELTSKFPESTEQFVTRWHSLQHRFLTCPLPTVAAINGHCYAGGAVMSLCHDYQVMNNERGWWCMNEVHLGLNFPVWILELCKLKLAGNGGKHLLDAVVCGKRYTAGEAKSCGIVDDIGSASELISKAMSIIDSRVGGSGLNRDFIHTTKCHLFSEVFKAAASNKQNSIGTVQHKSQL